MIDTIFNFIRSNTLTAIAAPTALNAMTFFTKLFIAYSDGVITEDEMAGLTSSANGLELAILGVIMFALKRKPS